jgi:hypothetical protein
MRLLITITLFLILGLLSAAGDEKEGPKQPEQLTVALGQANAIAGTVIAADAGAEARTMASALFEGAYIWQQPGVALVIVEIAEGWPASRLPDSERLTDFLLAQQQLSLSPPPLYPAEPAEGADSLDVPAIVCLLDSNAAGARLSERNSAYYSWVELNPGMDFIQPSRLSLRVDSAVIMYDSHGALEFYFMEQPDGSLRLAHFIMLDWFSA